MDGIHNDLVCGLDRCVCVHCKKLHVFVQLIDGICAKKNYLTPHNTNICVWVVCRSIFSKKKKERRNNLLKTVFERNCILKHEWSLQRVVLQLQNEFKQYLPLLHAMKDELLSMLLIPTHVYTLTTQDAIYHNRERVELAGARFPSYFKPLKVIRDNF